MNRPTNNMHNNRRSDQQSSGRNPTITRLKFGISSEPNLKEPRDFFGSSSSFSRVEGCFFTSYSFDFSELWNHSDSLNLIQHDIQMGYINSFDYKNAVGTHNPHETKVAYNLPATTRGALQLANLPPKTPQHSSRKTWTNWEGLEPCPL